MDNYSFLWPIEIGLAAESHQPQSLRRLYSLLSSFSNVRVQGIKGCGSITAIYTVLAEGEDMEDPIVDHVALS